MIYVYVYKKGGFVKLSLDLLRQEETDRTLMWPLKVTLIYNDVDKSDISQTIPLAISLNYT